MNVAGKSPTPSLGLLIATSILLACGMTSLDLDATYTVRQTFRSEAGLIDRGEVVLLKSVLTIVCLPVFGWASDRFGTGRVIVVATSIVLAVAVFRTLLPESAGKLHEISLINFLSLVCVTSIVVYTLITRLTPHDRVPGLIVGVWVALSVLTFALHAGIEAIHNTGSLAFTNAYPVPVRANVYPALGTAVCAVAAAIWIWLRQRRDQDAAEKEDRRPVPGILIRPRFPKAFWFLVIALALSRGSEQFLQQTPMMLVGDASIIQTFRIGSSAGVLSFLCVLIAGYLGIRYRFGWTAAGIELLRALSVAALLLFVGSATGVLVSASVFHVLNNCTLVLTLVLISRHIPGDRHGFAFGLAAAGMFAISIAVTRLVYRSVVSFGSEVGHWLLPVAIMFGIISAALYLKVKEEDPDLAVQRTAKVFD